MGATGPNTSSRATRPRHQRKTPANTVRRIEVSVAGRGMCPPTRTLAPESTAWCGPRRGHPLSTPLGDHRPDIGAGLRTRSEGWSLPEPIGESMALNSVVIDSPTINPFPAVYASPDDASSAASASDGPLHGSGLCSASSNTMNGAFPPSSIDVRSTRSADRRRRLFPTAVDPVNDTLRSRGSAQELIHNL